MSSASHLALLVFLIRAVGEALLDARPPGHLEARPAIYITWLMTFSRAVTKHKIEDKVQEEHRGHPHSLVK